jgi:hypothetical protein
VSADELLMHLFEQWREVIDSEPFSEWDPNLVVSDA